MDELQKLLNWDFATEWIWEKLLLLLQIGSLLIIFFVGGLLLLLSVKCVTAKEEPSSNQKNNRRCYFWSLKNTVWKCWFNWSQRLNTVLPTDSKRIRDIFIASHANIMEKLFVQSFLLLAGILGCWWGWHFLNSSEQKKRSQTNLGNTNNSFGSSRFANCPIKHT